MDFKGKRVLLLDGYGRQIPSILIQLHRLGCIVTTICESKLDVGYTSRYPKKRIAVHGIREDSSVYKAAIEDELAKNSYDVLFPVLERATDICISDEFKAKYPDIKVIAATREAFEKAYDKQQTMRICMENNIPCPITKMDDETMEEYLSKVSFPICAKPRKGSGGAGFKRIMNREELDKYIADGTIKVEEYVIQELIPKGGSQYGGYVLMDKDHKPQFTMAVESCRWFPIDGGPGCYIRTINHPGMNDSSNRLLEKLDWTSFGHIGYIMDPRDNTPKVMEINGRIPASIKICDWAGMDPVKNMLLLAYGEKLEPITKPVPEHLALRYFHTDLLWFIKNPNRFKANPSWFYCRKQKDYIFSWSDPVPFFSYAIEHAMSYRKDMAKRKH
ncbi:MAG: ATP-grasp domain-containing protein [Clostridia bacterium]|nr:ATP-grasp domain-containing protein [Clostridia bacterium]